MKNRLLILFSFLFILGFTACEDDIDLDFTANQDADGIEFTNSFLSEYLISEQISTNIAERFVWEPADFGAPVNVTYELQGSVEPTFDNFEVVASTSKLNVPVSVSQLLDFAEDLGLDNDPDTEAPNVGQVFFRLRAFTGTDGASVIDTVSAVQPITIRWIESGGEEPPLRNLFLVGDATAAGWDNNGNNTPMFRDPDNSDIYFLTGRFTAGEFKLLEEKGQWQPQWGVTDGNLAVNDGTGDDPGTFTIPEEGFYTVEVNLDEMTFSITPFDASGEPTWNTIGIIGDATPNDWNAPDTDMTQSTFNSHLWFISGIALTDGEMKFRANDDWTNNWGANTALSGQGTQDGPNIPVVAATYDVWFNDITKRYILIPVE